MKRHDWEWHVGEVPLDCMLEPLQVYQSPSGNLLYAVSSTELGDRYTLDELRTILNTAEQIEKELTIDACTST